MRLSASSSLVLLAFAACSSSSASSAPVDASAQGDDGSTAGCTSIGGTCESYAAGCPILQQNGALCGNVILVCCLPPGGPTLGTPEAGGEMDAAPMGMPAEAGTPTPPDDATVPPPPPKDAGAPRDASGPNDAASPVDAPID
jgi:hypothetical protein